ncbi:MAG: hypothetical protein JJT96_09630 [Opitutales bacterium]|nr:hypothetical protein [Opitutales bacterium]
MKPTQCSLLTSALAILIGSLPATASWQLVDNFESGMDNVFSLRFPEPEPTVGIFEDPTDPANNMFYLDSNAYGVVDWAPNYVAIALPSPITNQATFYMRFHNLGSGHDMSAGLSPVAIVPNPEAPHANGMSQPGGWAAMEAQFQMHAPGSNLFRVRDGAAFVPSQVAIPNNEWVEIWMHVDLPANTTEFYVKRAADADPVQVVFSDDFGAEKTAASFRNGTTEPLVTFFMGTVAGLAENPLPGDPFFVDDLYLDVTGLNLTSPLDGSTGPMWAGFPIDANGFVNTGSWLGLVYPVGDFVYVPSIEGWIFLPEENVSEDGAWTYFLR